MKELTAHVIEDLVVRTKSIIDFSEQVLMNTNPEELKRRPSEDKWNVLECVYHLSLYAQFYLPALEREINISRNNNFKNKEFYSPGTIGKFFYQSMLPQEDGKVRTMKTFKDKNTLGLAVPETAIEDFITEQKHFLTLLKQAQFVDLEKTRVPLTITRLIKLKLGDALRFNIYHNERHVNQMKACLESISKQQVAALAG